MSIRSYLDNPREIAAKFEEVISAKYEKLAANVPIEINHPSVNPSQLENTKSNDRGNGVVQ